MELTVFTCKPLRRLLLGALAAGAGCGAATAAHATTAADGLSIYGSAPTSVTVGNTTPTRSRRQ